MQSSDEILTRDIRQACAAGYQLYDAENYKAALRVFYQAWLRLPKPQSEHEEAGWVLTAIGDSYFRDGQYQLGCEALQSALFCPNMDNAPFVHLRLGQCKLELGQLRAAETALLRAYVIAGMNIFATEERKYFFAIAMLLDRQQLQDAPDTSAFTRQHQRFYIDQDASAQ